MKTFRRWSLGILIGGGLLLAIPEESQAQAGGAPPSAAGGAQAPGDPTAISRPDSLRALVLERLRAAPSVVEEEVEEGEEGAPEEEGDDAALPDTASTDTGATTVTQPPDGADPFMTSLLELEGITSSSSYEGARVDFEIAREIVNLWGDEDRRARFSGQGNQVEADTAISLDNLQGVIRTRGAAEFTPETGDPITAERLVYSLREGRGTALGAETEYSEGVSWIVRGDLDSVRDGELFASETIFTSCELDEPHSYFKSDRIKILDNQVLVARSVKLYFGGVPVMWLPFMAQSLGTGRASGLLTPSFSVNDIIRSSSGYNRRVANLGYYWAMSDYSEMSVAMDWYSNDYIALDSRVGYQWARKFLSGTVNLKHYWRESGSRALALNTRHNWAISERTQLGLSGNYASSSDLVTQYSLDPRELTQTIDSDGTFARRFDWGMVNLGASRKQFLGEEKTEMTLPSASLSLSTLTLFGAPPQTASWYNNLSVSGSANWKRRQLDRPFQPDTTFTFLQASGVETTGSARGSLGLGDISLSGSVEMARNLFREVPLDTLPGATRRDFNSGLMSWSAGLSYRLRLIGSTTVSPSVSIGASLVQVDSIPEAANFVQGPMRRSIGVGVQTDFYGFYPGVGQFEAIRHKVSPNLSWSYAPEVESTDLQRAVFGSRVSQRVNTLSFGFSQTWEGKVREGAEGAPTSAPAGGVSGGGPGGPLGGSGQLPPGAPGGTPAGAAVPAAGVPADTTEAALLAQEAEEAEGGPRRLPPSRTRMLLGLNTGGLNYDLVRGDSLGFLAGFTTTSISTTVTSDYLRGLNLSFTHDLFDDSRFQDEGLRSFSPHLSQLALGFSLSDQSGFVRALTRLLGGNPGDLRTEPAQPANPFGAPQGATDPFTGFDPNRVIQGTSGTLSTTPTRREGWDAQINYSLRRPRKTDFPEDQGIFGFQEPTAQMISTSVSFSPTELWNVGWVTSYDVEAGRFSDHVVRLNRDLHEWQASFGFRQTPLGIWSFQFEVSLKANQDLRFDYEQRSTFGAAGL